MRCTVCGAELMPGAAFCTKCGTPVPAAPAGGVCCPTCGAMMPEGRAFCTKCGTPLSAAPAAPAAYRCATCGAELQEGYDFCTKCGTPVSAQGDRQQGYQQQGYQQQGFQQGGFAVPVEPEYPPEAYEPVYEEEEPKRKSNWLLWTILGVVAALAIAAAILFATGFFDGDKDKDDDDEDEEYSDTVKDEDDEDEVSGESTAAPDEEEDDAEDEDKDKASESGSDTAEDTETMVRNTVVAYFDAFIKDVNNGSYGALNAVVQHGSQVEREQKDFIAKGVARNLREELLDYTILSATQQSDTCWRVSTEEKYEIWQSGDPSHWWVVQRCTYVVYQQSDGSWKIAELTDLKTVDSGNY